MPTTCMSKAQPATETKMLPKNVTIASGSHMSRPDSNVPLLTKVPNKMPPISPNQAMTTNNRSIFVRFIYLMFI